MSAEENPWAHEASPKEAREHGSNTKDSGITVANAVPKDALSTDDHHLTADSKDNIGLTRSPKKEEDEKLTDKFMAEEDRAYCELFFGTGETQHKKEAGKQDTAGSAKENEEERQGALKAMSPSGRRAYYDTFKKNATHGLSSFS